MGRAWVYWVYWVCWVWLRLRSSSRLRCLAQKAIVGGLVYWVLLGLRKVAQFVGHMLRVENAFESNVCFRMRFGFSGFTIRPRLAALDLTL